MLLTENNYPIDCEGNIEKCAFQNVYILVIRKNLKP